MTRIIGSGIYIPGKVTKEDFIEKFGKKARAVTKLVHHDIHYLATDINDGKILISNLDMAEKASRSAIDDAGLAVNDIDLIIYSSATPDYVLPPNYVLLQKRIGIKRCMGFDIRSGCAGFGTALTIADIYIKSGKIKNALIVGSDLMSSRFSKFPKEELDTKTIFNYMFFGDCAGALVLSGDGSTGGIRILYSKAESTYAEADNGSALYIGGSRYPYPTDEIESDKWAAYQAAGLSEEYLSKTLIETFKEFREETGIGLFEIDRFIMPIESSKIAERVFSEFPEIEPEKICSNKGEGGALINAAIPLAVDCALKNGEIVAGNKVLIYAAENTQWQHAILYLEW